MRKSRLLASSVVLVILAAGTGCASAPTYRGFFERYRPALPATDQGLLLETLRVIALLEEYCSALEERDLDRLLACYSPRYSHYEHGLEWREKRIEESYFTPFGSLEARFGPVAAEFVRQSAGYWMRQEDFDWLQSPRGEHSPSRSYRITLPAAAGPVELLFGELAEPAAGPGRDYSLSRLPGAKREEKTGDEPVPVSVSSLVDPGVESPLGEVAFPLAIRGRLRVEGDSGDFVSTLRERVIFLLEKEDGEWKIVSQY